MQHHARNSDKETHLASVEHRVLAGWQCHVLCKRARLELLYHLDRFLGGPEPRHPPGQLLMRLVSATGAARAGRTLVLLLREGGDGAGGAGGAVVRGASARAAAAARGCRARGASTAHLARCAHPAAAASVQASLHACLCALWVYLDAERSGLATYPRWLRRVSRLLEQERSLLRTEQVCGCRNCRRNVARACKTKADELLAFIFASNLPPGCPLEDFGFKCTGTTPHFIDRTSIYL